MMYHKILKLEDMQNMTIDQIVNLYREGYNLEDSNIKQQTSNIGIKSMQYIPSADIITILFLGFVSSFAASYMFYNYNRKNIRNTNYMR